MNSQLVFIMGAPRSGTTALTRLLASHPDVFLADAQALKTTKDGRPTFESAVFVRDYSDEDVQARFAALDGKAGFIVEKTPIHILHIDRIRRLFPGARFILTYRPPHGCMRSWKVARTTFLKSGTFEQACATLARSIAQIAEKCSDEDVAVMRFPVFMDQTEAAGRALFRHIGLDERYLAACLSDMTNPDLERVKGVVGESVLGGRTSLTVDEQATVTRICGDVDAKWKATPGKNLIRP